MRRRYLVGHRNRQQDKAKGSGVESAPAPREPLLGVSIGAGGLFRDEGVW